LGALKVIAEKQAAVMARHDSLTHPSNAGFAVFTARLRQVYTSVAERGQRLLTLSRRGGSADAIEALTLDLLAERGEASNLARAEAILRHYAGLSPEKKQRFHFFLAENFHPDTERLKHAAEAYLSAPSQETIAALTRAAEPPRRELLQRLNAAPGATQFLLAMRKAILAEPQAAAKLKPLEQDLRHVFGAWFNRGFLELKRIEWTSPAAVLEKLIAYEAVHEIKGWDDLHRRLAADRRCFAFFHPALPDDPLIFVEVALGHELAPRIAPLLSLDAVTDASPKPDTAIFYSISNCQPGLRGISLGDFLIKQVVEELRAELPSLKRFATLSPVPSFRKWLAGQMRANGESVLSPEERVLLSDLADPTASGLEQMDISRKSALQRLMAVYLTARNDGAGPEDPVARFHLRNGARLERINWAANLSTRGMAESLGMMVNYIYDLDAIENNHARLVSEGRVASSAQIGELVKKKSRAPYAKPAQAEARTSAGVESPSLATPPA
jgi:malonyl-CoA decarboxylase